MKVVIVKDIEEMPNECDSCPFQDYDRYCGILGEYSLLNEWVEDAPYYDLKEKGDCPLKPMPKEFGNDIDEDYARGWNDCLKEILDESNSRD